MKYLVTLILILACAFQKIAAQSPAKISVTPFSYNGNDISGATLSLYFTTADRKKGTNNIFITEFTHAAICINGKTIKLKAVKPYTETSEVYAGGQYEVSLKKMNYKDAGYEQIYLDAVLTVKAGSNIVYQRKVFGNLSD